LRSFEFDLPLEGFLAELARLPPGASGLVCAVNRRSIRFTEAGGRLAASGEASSLNESRTRLTLQYPLDFRPLFTAAAGAAIAVVAFLRPGLPFAQLASALGFGMAALMLIAWRSGQRRQQERIAILLSRHQLRRSGASPVLGLEPGGGTSQTPPA
jgi:hypothetical protein